VSWTTQKKATKERRGESSSENTANFRREGATGEKLETQPILSEASVTADKKMGDRMYGETSHEIKKERNLL